MTKRFGLLLSAASRGIGLMSRSLNLFPRERERREPRGKFDVKVQHEAAPESVAPLPAQKFSHGLEDRRETLPRFGY